MARSRHSLDATLLAPRENRTDGTDATDGVVGGRRYAIPPGARERVFFVQNEPKVTRINIGFLEKKNPKQSHKVTITGDGLNRTESD